MLCEFWSRNEADYQQRGSKCDRKNNICLLVKLNFKLSNSLLQDTAELGNKQKNKTLLSISSVLLLRMTQNSFLGAK